MHRRPRLPGNRLVTVLALVLAPLLGPSLAAARDVVLVLDASGSMWSKVGTETKIEVARRTLREALGTLPAATTLALIAYGHRREGDCADIETLIPPGDDDRAALLAKVDALKPKGKTPLTGALEQAIALLRGRDATATVVLLSDGLETCGGDPCAVVRAAKKAGTELIVHVVGFDVKEADVSQLECIAQAGDGLYVEAGDAAQLGTALGRVLSAPSEVPPSRLSIGARANGDLADALVTVRTAGKKEEVASGRTYRGADTNPRVFAVPPGTYDVEVQPIGVDGLASQTLDAISVPDGATVERVAEFGFGEIAIGVTRNGALCDATVTFFPAGGSKALDVARTYRDAETNPRVVKLPAGTYDVELKGLEIAGGSVERIAGVVVEPGRRVERAHDFASGTLRVGATAAGKRVDAVVRVSPAGTSSAAVQGRTYEQANSNPKAFDLTPGTYDVEVSRVRAKDAKAERRTVEVPRGGIAEVTIEFGS